MNAISPVRMALLAASVARARARPVVKEQQRAVTSTAYLENAPPPATITRLAPGNAADAVKPTAMTRRAAVAAWAETATRSASTAPIVTLNRAKEPAIWCATPPLRATWQPVSMGDAISIATPRLRCAESIAVPEVVRPTSVRILSRELAVSLPPPRSPGLEGHRSFIHTHDSYALYPSGLERDYEKMPPDPIEALRDCPAATRDVRGDPCHVEGIVRVHVTVQR